VTVDHRKELSQEGDVSWKQRIGKRSLEPDRVVLNSAKAIDAATVIRCGGMRASPLTERFLGRRDRFGRRMVDEFMRVVGAPEVFAAGDVACAKIDGEHASVMSCQHARPMERLGSQPRCRPTRQAAAAAANRLVHYNSRSRPVGRGLHERLGSTCHCDRTRRKSNQAIDQFAAHLSTSDEKTREDLLAAAVPAVQAPPEIDTKGDLKAKTRLPHVLY
jgi:hypothetical protein